MIYVKYNMLYIIYYTLYIIYQVSYTIYYILNLIYQIFYIIEGSLEVKLPTIWTDEKAEQGRGREKRKIRRKKIKKKEDADARNTVFFQLFVAPEDRKVGSLSGGCGASWPEERWKIARRCGAKHISKSKG